MLPKEAKISLLALSLARKKNPNKYAEYASYRDKAISLRQSLIKEMLPHIRVGGKRLAGDSKKKTVKGKK